MHPTRLSFLRTLLRRMTSGDWQFDRPVWAVDAKGVGHAVYRAKGPERTYSLVAFAHDLPDHMRSDRVIATAWDATFALFDGMPTDEDIARLGRNVPLQEAGRVSTKELTLSRANRSVRLFSEAVDRLSKGLQPDAAALQSVGYLMRTTAVYGSGKFGAADWQDIADRPEMAAPFQAEMLTVWLIRQFTVDILDHLARARGGEKAVKLAPDLRQMLGVGNSTGLGMAPFLVRHPALLNNWMLARETALAKVRSLPEMTEATRNALQDAIAAARKNAESWRSDHPLQAEKLADLRKDLTAISDHAKQMDPSEPYPWNAFWIWGEGRLRLEGQEALLSILLEPHGALVDDLAAGMSADEPAHFRIDGAMTVGALRALLDQNFGWALRIDFDAPENQARFWYVSEEKLEPRLGDRLSDAGAEREQPLCIGRLAHDLAVALTNESEQHPVAQFLLRHPEHRMMVRRVQASRHLPYGEVQDNLIAHDMLPIDIMRCKLAFFGASHFEPRSDKWVRISLFQGAPYPLDGTWGPV